MAGELGKIQKTLKDQMRKKNFAYADLSKLLEVSEATIKRRLNGEDISIEQLREMASVMDIGFYELIELSKQQDNQVHTFTIEQENFLAKDLKNILVFRQLLLKKKLPQILKSTDLTEGSLRKILRYLEDYQLIKLMPQDKVLLQVSFPFAWLAGGPLEKTYDKVILESISARIKRPAINGINKKFEIALSAEQHSAFCQDLEKILQKYKNFSKVQMESQIETSDISSGILFIDRFSCWDRSQI